MEIGGIAGPGPTVRAAGGLLARSGGAGVEVLVVHRPRYDDWSFPKGKVDPGETELECALREVEEETGYRCRPGEELPATHYTDGRGRPKTVRYWRMAVVSGQFTANAEVSSAVWVPPSRALSLLTYEHDRKMLEELMSRLKPEPAALLIRHAAAGSRKRWEGDDRMRPLDEKGLRQAEWLAGQLEGYPIRRLVTSPYLRCVQTVEPLAARLGLRLIEADELAEGSSGAALLALADRLGEGLDALCTHGDVIEDLLGSDVPNKKGSFRVLRWENGTLEPADYIAPPR